MIGMHCSSRNNLQPKSLIDLASFDSPVLSETSPLEANFKKGGSFLSNWHSPPSTSTSTLSSSLGISGNEFVDLSHVDEEKFNLGVDEWESFLPGSVGNDQTLFGLIAGDVEDDLCGLKQGGNPNAFEANAGFEAIHESSGIQVIPTCFSSPNENDTSFCNNMLLGSLSSSCLGLSATERFNCDNVKLGQVENCLGSNSGNDDAKYLLTLPPGLVLPQQMQLQFENLGGKPQNYNIHLMVNQLPNVQSAPGVNFLNPSFRGSQPDHPPAKRHNPGIMNPGSGSQRARVAFVDPYHEALLKKQKELPPVQQNLFGLEQQLNSLPISFLPEKGFMVPKLEVGGGLRNQLSSVKQQDRQQQQILYGQLCKAMELILTQNFTQAQGILARLNHQLSPSDKPFQRCSFYFKEALQHVLLMTNSATSLSLRIPNPFDCMSKMSAYKAFSEASPLIQFINFTSNQALLEAVDDADCIHIIDFDIGFGAQWSSFIQELPRRKRGPPSSLKLTAFSSPSTHHTIEIRLMHGSLTQFANDVGINFELEIVNFDSFDPKFCPISSLRSSDNEAVVVNLPIWSIEMHLPLLPSLLGFIKQLSPKIVVSMERGCERFELPFPYHLLHALEYFEVVMDSLDAANMDPDAANKVERFLFQPKIESIVLGRLQSPEIMPSWRNLFASACFSPVGFSNFAEAQAECVIKNTHISGFNVEKRHASLVLCLQNHQLVTASAWRC